MKTYKAPDNSLHSLSPEDIANGGEKYLPADCVEITEAEAEEIRAANMPKPDPVQQVKDQIEAIETATKMNRATREFMLEQVVRETARDYNLDLSAEGVRETVQAGLYAGNVAYRRIKDIDDQIAALRAQIGEL